MSYVRGDIILADLPFTDGSGSKIRPALVVQCDHNNARLQDVILAIITRTTARAATEPTQLLIEITQPDGQASNLLHTSAVKCEHLVTLHASTIQRVIGRLSANLMAKIDLCLKASLDLT